MHTQGGPTWRGLCLLTIQDNAPGLGNTALPGRAPGTLAAIGHLPGPVLESDGREEGQGTHFLPPPKRNTGSPEARGACPAQRSLPSIVLPSSISAPSSQPHPDCSLPPPSPHPRHTWTTGCPRPCPSGPRLGLAASGLGCSDGVGTAVSRGRLPAPADPPGQHRPSPRVSPSGASVRFSQDSSPPDGHQGGQAGQGGAYHSGARPTLLTSLPTAP